MYKSCNIYEEWKGFMNSMLLKLGIFFIAIGIAKLIYSMYLKHKQN